MAMGIESRKILFAPELFRAPGGIARVSRHYLQALAEAYPAEELRAVILNDQSIGADALATCHAEAVQAIGCNRSKLRCAWELLRATRHEYVHVLCTHVALAPLLNLLRWIRPNLTFDIVVHGIEAWQPLPRSQQAALRKARLILSVSNYTRRELVSRYPELDAHTHVLPNALDPGFDSSLPTEKPVPFQILAVSRLAAHDWEKGIDHLIEAMPAVRKEMPKAHLRIVGDGVDRERLEALSHQLPDPSCVTFLGEIDDHDLRREFSSCEIFALPSRKEGFGLVYLEAMAVGKPCIVANAGGAPEVIDRDSGLIVPYGDVAQIASAITLSFKKIWDTEKVQTRAKYFAFPAFAQRWNELSSNCR